MTLTNRIILKLDDGGVIARASLLGGVGDEVRHFGLEDAAAAGRLTEVDVNRLARLVQDASSRTGHAGTSGLPAAGYVNGKRAVSGLEGPGSHSNAKRKKGSALGDLPNGSEASLGGGSWQVGNDFRHKCHGILSGVAESLGGNAIWFEAPVDGAAVPDYYKIIANPISFSEIRAKLDCSPEAGAYKTPQEFYDDMHLLWENCVKYNGKESFVGKAGLRGDAKFEELWASSGFDSGRHRRATAGIAAAKYEPNEAVAEKKPKRNGYDSFKRNGKRASFKMLEHYNDEMPREHMERLANSLGDLTGEELEGVLRIVREGQDQGQVAQTDGEIELSFDEMSNPTLWRLDAWMKDLERRRKAYANGNLQVVDDSDDDSDESDL